MESVDKIIDEIVIDEINKEVEIQDEASCFLRLSLYEGESLSVL